MAGRKLPNPPRYGGGNGTQKLPPLLDCRPFKGPKLTEEGKPFEPKYGEPRSYVSWGSGGHHLAAPGFTWMASQPLSC